MSDILDKFYTKKHKCLQLISNVANIFSWIVIIYFGFQLIIGLSSFNSPFGSGGFAAFAKQDPVTAFWHITSLIKNVLPGVVYFLLLQGLHQGLEMIVETDMNYRENMGGESNE